MFFSLKKFKIFLNKALDYIENDQWDISFQEGVCEHSSEISSLLAISDEVLLSYCSKDKKL